MKFKCLSILFLTLLVFRFSQATPEEIPIDIDFKLGSGGDAVTIDVVTKAVTPYQVVKNTFGRTITAADLSFLRLKTTHQSFTFWENAGCKSSIALTLSLSNQTLTLKGTNTRSQAYNLICRTCGCRRGPGCHVSDTHIEGRIVLLCDRADYEAALKARDKARTDSDQLERSLVEMRRSLENRTREIKDLSEAYAQHERELTSLEGNLEERRKEGDALLHQNEEQQQHYERSLEELRQQLRQDSDADERALIEELQALRAQLQEIEGEMAVDVDEKTTAPGPLPKKQTEQFDEL